MKNAAASPFAYTLTKPTLAISLDVSGIIRGCDFVSRIIMGKLCVKQNDASGRTVGLLKRAWAASGEGIQKYELDGVTADFKQFHIGDTVPPLYLTPEYNIKQWQQRNLPAPDAGTRWTYMGGSYVLITETEGKILKIYDGEIFYHR